MKKHLILTMIIGWLLLSFIFRDSENISENDVTDISSIKSYENSSNDFVSEYSMTEEELQDTIHGYTPSKDIYTTEILGEGIYYCAIITDSSIFREGEGYLEINDGIYHFLDGNEQFMISLLFIDENSAIGGVAYQDENGELYALIDGEEVLEVEQIEEGIKISSIDDRLIIYLEK